MDAFTSADRRLVEHFCRHVGWGINRFDTIATARHMDDVARTTLMNLLLHGEFAAIMPRREPGEVL